MLIQMTYLSDESLLDGDESVTGCGVERFTVLGVDHRRGDVLEGVDDFHRDLIIVNDVASFNDADSCIRVGCQKVSVGKRSDE